MSSATPCRRNRLTQSAAVKRSPADEKPPYRIGGGRFAHAERDAERRSLVRLRFGRLLAVAVRRRVIRAAWNWRFDHVTQALPVQWINPLSRRSMTLCIADRRDDLGGTVGLRSDGWFEKQISGRDRRRRHLHRYHRLCRRRTRPSRQDALDPARFLDRVIDSIRSAADLMGISLGDLLAQTSLFMHGSTVVDNTILTRDGARTGLDHDARLRGHHIDHARRLWPMGRPVRGSHQTPGQDRAGARRW